TPPAPKRITEVVRFPCALSSSSWKRSSVVVVLRSSAASRSDSALRYSNSPITAATAPPTTSASPTVSRYHGCVARVDGATLALANGRGCGPVGDPRGAAIGLSATGGCARGGGASIGGCSASRWSGWGAPPELAMGSGDLQAPIAWSTTRTT